MIASVIGRAGDQLGDALPRVAGALLLLVLGLLAAIVLGRLTRRALVRAGLDRFADRSGTSELLGQAGLSNSLSALIGTAVRLTIVVVAVFASLTLLGLAFLSDSLNEGILYIPRLARRARARADRRGPRRLRARLARPDLGPARLPGRDRTGRAGARRSSCSGSARPSRPASPSRR